VPLGYRQIQDTFHGLVIHADQRNKVLLILKVHDSRRLNASSQ
jgi:hypothetical protein